MSTDIAQAIANHVDTIGYDIAVTPDARDAENRAGRIDIAHSGKTIWSVDADDMLGCVALAIVAIRDHQAA